jgi:hypothetical protein
MVRISTAVSVSGTLFPCLRYYPSSLVNLND